MPGYAGWKVLYQEEYKQLKEEGYEVGECEGEFMDGEFLPLPRDVQKTIKQEEISEEEWKEAYKKLWKVREKGIRSEYPFKEPNCFLEIIKDSSIPDLIPLSARDYEERIKGAWFGRCAAVVLGKPLEMGYGRKEIERYLRSVDAWPLWDWVPEKSKTLDISLREDCIPSTKGHVKYVQPDDDVQYTILALLLYEKKGGEFTALDVGMNWLDNIPYHWCWCAARQMYYHLINGTESPTEEEIRKMVLKINPWRECIDGQIRADFWGYLHPADPINAARMAHRECTFGLVKNGLYGAMFVAGCLAGALSAEPSVYLILDCGMQVIPKTSRLYKAVAAVRRWYDALPGWEAVCEKIEETYGHLPFADTINNMCMVVLALLHGGLDYSRTITTAVMCGIDTDCNGGTAGSIVGAAVGYERIDKKWIDPLHDTVKTVVAGYGEGTISGLVRRTIAAREKKVN